MDLSRLIFAFLMTAFCVCKLIHIADKFFPNHIVWYHHVMFKIKIKNSRTVPVYTHLYMKCVDNSQLKAFLYVYIYLLNCNYNAMEYTHNQIIIIYSKFLMCVKLECTHIRTEI